MNDIEVSLQDTQDISTQVYDINYIPDYVKAEQERRENEVIRQANELLRIALYEDLEYKKDTDYWRGTGIASIEKTDTEGLVDTYTITYENGYTSTFTVTNGKYDRIAGANATIDDNIGTPSVTVNTTSILAPDGTGYIKNFSFNFSNLKGEKGEQGERGEAGSIKFLIVAELPQTGADDTIYLVPITPDEGDNNYAEYIYVNGEWELLGKIGVHVDLTDYYTKGETNTLLNAKENTSNKVTSISSSSTDTQYPSAKCVYDSQATQDTKITNLENQVFGDETIEVENTSMTLDGTLKGQFNSIDLKGNTSQTGTPTPSSPIPVNVVSGDNEINVCGKNKLSPTLNDINETISSVKREGVNGTYTLSGTATAGGGGNVQYVLTNTYTIQNGDYLHLCNSTINTNSTIMILNENDTQINNWSFNAINRVIDISSYAGQKIKSIGFYNNSSFSGSLTTSPMIINSNTVTNFEPYQGNTYNIDLPVENLLQLPNGSKTTNGITATITNGKLKIVGTTTTNWFSICDLNIPLESGTYTFSYTNKKVNRYNFNIKYADNTTQVIYGNTYSNTLITLSQKATITGMFSDNNTTGATFDYEDYLMIEKGSKANSFTPYGTTPIELCKIGNYQDYFYKDSGKWYLHKEIGKAVFTGASGESYGVNANWDNQATNILHIFTNDVRNTWKIGQSGFLSNRFICTTESGRDFAQEMITCHTTNETPYFFIKYDNLSGVSSSSTVEQKVNAFKQWLSSNNVTLYYILANPTVTEITYQPLIDQLNELEKAISYEGQTNISQTNNDLPFIITASAFLNNINGKIGLLNKLTEV